jgi:hypothetical protein
MITPSFALTATERVLPRLALDFTTASLDPRVTFTRTGNTATVTNSSGYVVGINANLPRFDYDPITLACKGLLIEEQRTNLALYSSDFTNGVYSLVNVTLSANSVIAPDNTQTADTLTQNTATGNHNLLYGLVVGSSAAGAYSLSMYVKPNGTRYIQAQLTDNATGSFGTASIYDLQTGTVTSGVGTITNVGNGWFRITTTGTKVNTAVDCGIQLFMRNSTNTSNSFTGDGTSGVHIWGAQLEVGAFSTSYIPTVASTVLRNADIATMTGTNFTSWFNQPQGSFMARFAGAVKTSTWAFQMDSGGGNFTNRIACSPGTNNNLIISNAANVNQCTLGDYTGVDNVFVNITGSYNTDNFATSYNGTSAILDNSGTPSLPTAMIIGARNTASPTGFLNSWIQKFYYWPQQLTNAEVQAFSK